MSVPCLSNSTWSAHPAEGRESAARLQNLGVTHITNGCYRLHPVEWNIGESAGLLAAFALTQRKAHARSAIKSLCSPIFNGLCKIKESKSPGRKLTPR